MELLAVYDRAGRQTGLRPRAEVHRSGLWHKSAHVYVFDAAGRLLLQQRSAQKDLYAGRWDYSVGEHLQPEEDALAAARRGLAEELGITGRQSLTPLGPPRWAEFVGHGYCDREIQHGFQMTYTEVLHHDAGEVAQLRYIDACELQAWIAAEPEVFTPWLLADLPSLSFLP